MRDVDECDFQLVLHPDQLILHVLPELQVKGAERLVQQQHARFVHDRAGDGDSLLLTAGKVADRTFFKALKTDQFQGVMNLVLDVGSGFLLYI